MHPDLPPNPPILRTERLLLRPLERTDAPAIQRYFDDWEVIKRMSTAVPWPYPADGAERFIEDVALAQMNAGEGLLWAITLADSPGTTIGVMHYRKVADQTGNRGFWLGRPFWGQGYMTEAVEAVQDYLFFELGVERITVLNSAGNEASRRIKQKTGARFVGEVTLAHHACGDGAQEWEVTAESWRAHRFHEVPAAPVRVETASEAAGLMSFADYQERCLYHPEHGYYASGNVDFGHDGHFWTFAQGMSPVFGWMLAEAARRLLAELARLGAIPSDAPVALLELGGGDGSMAVDICAYIERHADTDRWRPWAGRIRYVLGDRSGGLRDIQGAALKEYVASGRAEVRALGARVGADWDGPFYGVVISNEMMDVMPCERLRIHGPGPEVSRIHLRPRDPTCGRPISPAEFWGRVENQRPWALEEVEVPMDLGWLSAGTVGDPPPDLAAYLATLAPLVDDLAACEHLPVDVVWLRDLPDTVSDLSALLNGPDRAGAAILIDYGGTSRHICDPNTVTHLRVYGEDREAWHSDAVYDSPYADDVTQDIDFTELARLVRSRGMQVLAYGHQRLLDTGDADIEAAEATAALEAAAHGLPPARIVERFRHSPGFQLIVFSGSAQLGVAGPFADSADVDGEGLATLRRGVDRRDLAFALGDAGLNPGIAVALKPCGDLAADLNDRGYQGTERRVAALLRRRGWLAEPGDV